MQTLKKIPGTALESETIQGSFYVSTVEQPNPGYNIMEIWKDIPGFEGSYQVSNHGRVKSLARKIMYKDGRIWNKKDNIILKQSINNKGYLFVNLSKKAIFHVLRVHKLVLNAFVPNPENKPQCNHKDGIKINNYATNLEWVTNSENQIHAVRLGIRGTKLCVRDVVEIKKSKNNITKLELSQKYKVSISLIEKIYRNEIWNHVN